MPPRTSPSSAHAARPRAVDAVRAPLLWVGVRPDAELERALEQHGHALHWVADTRAALGAPLPATLVVDALLPDGDGLVLLEELSRRAPALVGVALAVQPSYALLRRARRLGARDLLARPVDAAELCAALAGPRSAEAPGELFQRDDATERDLLLLAAALLAAGASAALRARVVTAAAELIALARPACVAIRARRAGGRIELAARSSGFGLEAESTRLAATATPRTSALSRAVALCEAFEAAHVEGELALSLAFDAGVALGADGQAADLADREWLDPRTAERLLAELAHGRAALAPSHGVAVVLGRWLGERSASLAERRAQRALWS